jgi:hypothetical protein
VRSHAQPPHLGDEPFRVVVLVGTDRLLVGTSAIGSHLLGRIPLAVANRSAEACGYSQRHPAINHQVVAVLHEHMPSVVQLSWMGIGFPSQQSLGIRAGTVGLVAELDTAEVPFCPLLSFLGGTESLART